MRASLPIALLAVAVLAACATTGTQLATDGKQALDKASLCCTTLADATALPLPAEKQQLRIDTTRQAFLFDGVKSFFVLYRLPEFKRTYSILVSSTPEGTMSDTAIFLPRITLYDGDFRQTRHFDERTLRSRGSTMERTVFINPSNAGERYIAIHASDMSAPIERTVSMQTVQPIAVGTGMFMMQNGMDVKTSLRPVPVGVIDIEVNGLPAPGR